MDRIFPPKQWIVHLTTWCFAAKDLGGRRSVTTNLEYSPPIQTVSPGPIQEPPLTNPPFGLGFKPPEVASTNAALEIAFLYLVVCCCFPTNGNFL